MALHAAGLANALKQSGMLEMDYDVILRGLSQRGFAELDARRAKTPFQWITFSALPNHQLEIIACFTRQPPQEFLSSPLEATTRCPLLLEKAELCQQSPWMIRWLFIRH